MLCTSYAIYNNNNKTILNVKRDSCTPRFYQVKLMNSIWIYFLVIFGKYKGTDT